MISVGDRADEGNPAGGELEEHDAEREEIRAVIDRPPERLLGRHVGHGADDHAGDRDLRLREPRRLGALGLDELGQPEVEHLDEPALGPHQVRALDVAVHDPARVRLVQGVGDLQADLHDLADRQRPLRHARRQQLALDVLHHDEVGAARFADVVGHGDVGRPQERRGPRFVQEPRAALGIRLQVGGQELRARPNDRGGHPPLDTLRPCRRRQGARRCDNAERSNQSTCPRVCQDAGRRERRRDPLSYDARAGPDVPSAVLDLPLVGRTWVLPIVVSGHR